MEDIIITIMYCIIGILLCGVLYCLYQLIRNTKIFKIRSVWIETNDKRWFKHSYDFMMDPNQHNWFGFRYPKDKHYNKGD